MYFDTRSAVFGFTSIAQNSVVFRCLVWMGYNRCSVINSRDSRRKRETSAIILAGVTHRVSGDEKVMANACVLQRGIFIDFFLLNEF